MLRSIWLGLMFLIAVVGLAAVKFAIPLDVANVPQPSKAIKQTDRFVSIAEQPTTVGSTLHEQQAAPEEPPLAKTDKVAALTTEPVVIKTIPVVISPQHKPHSEAPKQPIKIVSRHWRDPLAPKLPTTKAAKSVQVKKTAKLSP